VFIFFLSSLALALVVAAALVALTVTVIFFLSSLLLLLLLLVFLLFLSFVPSFLRASFFGSFVILWPVFLFFARGETEREQKAESWHPQSAAGREATSFFFLHRAKKEFLRASQKRDARIFLSARAGETRIKTSSFRGRIIIHAYTHTRNRAEKIVIRENNGFRALRSGRVGGLGVVVVVDAFEKSKKSDGEK
jgi:hypothetical protein